MRLDAAKRSPAIWMRPVVSAEGWARRIEATSKRASPTDCADAATLIAMKKMAVGIARLFISEMKTSHSCYACTSAAFAILVAEWVKRNRARSHKAPDA